MVGSWVRLRAGLRWWADGVEPQNDLFGMTCSECLEGVRKCSEVVRLYFLLVSDSHCTLATLYLGLQKWFGSIRDVECSEEVRISRREIFYLSGARLRYRTGKWGSLYTRERSHYFPPKGVRRVWHRNRTVKRGVFGVFWTGKPWKMPTEFGGNFLPEIRVELEVSSYRRVLWVSFELFIVMRASA